MNRREFTRITALTAAAAKLSGASLLGQSAPSVKKIGFAVVGLGRIAQAFMDQVAPSGRDYQAAQSNPILGPNFLSTTQVTAFVTGHPEKAAQWKQKYNLPDIKVYSYEQIAEMRANPAVDAVYIATPNGLHKDHTAACARAGKHVLCEKPMAISAAECREMIAACKQANVKLMIGYRMHYDRMHLEARKIIADGNLGKIVTAEGSFGFNIQQNEWRTTKKLGGGGPLFDVGIYPLNAICFLLGERPTSYTAILNTTDTTSGRFKEVEESMAWTMAMPSGVVTALTTSYGANLPGMLRIHGEKGVLEFGNPFGNGDIQLTGSYGRTRVNDNTPKIQDQLRIEAEHLAACIRNNTVPDTPGEEGLADHTAFESIYRAAGHPL